MRSTILAFTMLSLALGGQGVVSLVDLERGAQVGVRGDRLQDR